MYELGPPKTTDAWVEELAQDNRDIWKKYTDGFNLFTRELFAEAMLCFNTYNNENPNDPVDLINWKMLSNPVSQSSRSSNPSIHKFYVVVSI